MTDSLPISSLPISSTPIPALRTTNPVPAPAEPSDRIAARHSSETTPQSSFASALQSRLKAMAGNKTASPASPAVADEKLQASDSATIAFPVSAGRDGLLFDQSAGGAPKIINAIEDVLGGNAPTDASSVPPPDAVALLPLALNIATLTAQSNLPQRVATPTPSGTGEHGQSRETITALANTDEQAAGKSTAILAEQPEKTVQTAAKSQIADSANIDFRQALHDALPQSAVPSTQFHAAAPLAAALPLSRPIASAMTSAHWASDIGNQVVWMANQRESRADLILNPPQLGRIEVSITVNGDQASASFVSANPEVREALQGSLPRLREVLADAGLFLAQTNIGAESSRQGGAEAEKGGKSPDDSFPSAKPSLLGLDDGSLSIAALPASRGRGLIDLFA